MASTAHQRHYGTRMSDIDLSYTVTCTSILKFLSKLIKSDAAYATENGVYFAVEKFSEYGKLWQAFKKRCQ